MERLAFPADDSRVIHQNIHRPQPPFHILKHGCRFPAVRNVKFFHNGFSAAGGNLPYKPVELIRYDNIGGGDACTGFGKAPHRIAPDQSARPRNQCYFSMQLFFHHDSPCSNDFR